MNPTLTDARTVADYFIWKAQQEGKPVTNKKLQKLLYYAQAWSLALHDKPVFSQKIEAWVHGPAIRDIYLEYKEFGYNPIKKKVDAGELDLTSDIREHLDAVWKVYGKYDAPYLEVLTHSESPWQDARAGLEPDESSENVIELDVMRDFYRKKLEATESF